MYGQKENLIDYSHNLTFIGKHLEINKYSSMTCQAKQPCMVIGCIATLSFLNLTICAKESTCILSNQNILNT